MPTMQNCFLAIVSSCRRISKHRDVKCHHKKLFGVFATFKLSQTQALLLGLKCFLNYS
ncbi:hypothetical protein AALO_G00092360 [Alosa alosa]|uniref:Uncharacterized protein n=1 Tax=Alosa alosa TaxID=278164 RepID=A0AAV6GVM0_9TELE|nr:hypothetical protein AALO_G00092360 [Alosa alosa]